MGKVPTATAITEAKRRKKKGRPSKNPVSVSASAKPPVSNSTSRRSTRRNPNHFNSPPQPEFDDDDDDDERKEKKVKLVVRLPQSDEKSMVAESQQQQISRHSNDSDSGSESASGSGSDPEDEDLGGRAKKRKIIGVDRGSDVGDLDQDKEVVKTTETPLHGSSLESGPTTPLPDKKLLVFILDRLQKKDTYGVFSEPVDADELPDYFDIIKQPMDFGTVRKKLENGAYKTLEELEADVNLICSNAMEYNASYTVYYRQARSIEELARRDFSNLKHEGDDGEPQPKVVRRGRPPSNKNQNKSLETSPIIDRASTELSSGATLANIEDKAAGSNLYNPRKGSALLRSRSNEPFVSSYGSRNGEIYLETDWYNEFPASILRADMKYGKKQFTVDENKRDTYRESSNSVPFLYNSVGNMKRLVPVGLQEAHAYARSLARYASNLGPVAWKIASKKIDAALPAGVQYGPGWVGDSRPPSQPLPTPIEVQKPSNSTTGYCSSRKLTTPSTSDLNSAVGKLNSQDELAGQGDTSSRRTLFSPQQSHSLRNGSNGMVGYDLCRIHEQAPLPPKKAEMGPMNSAHGEGEKWAFVQSQQSRALSIPPDLNVRVPGGSPRPGLQIGSPRQPDLALQL